MYRLLRILIWVGLIFPTPFLLLAETPASSGPENSTSAVTVPFEPPGPRGEILFFPDKKPRPRDDRHPMKAGAPGEVCVKIRAGSSPTLGDIKKQAVGFQLILEDNEDPPHQITLVFDNKSRILQKDPQGCYRGNFKIPETTQSGVYQIADLLFHSVSGNHISIREYLYELGKADELIIENPSKDLTGPNLVSIQNAMPREKKFQRYSGQLSARVKNSFLFEDEGFGIDPNSFRAFYALYEDGIKTGVYESRCEADKEDSRYAFHCTLNLVRPRNRWMLRKIRIELESLYLKDKADHQTVIADPQIFTEKAQGNPVKVSFENLDKGVKRQNTHPNHERQKPVQPWEIGQ